MVKEQSEHGSVDEQSSSGTVRVGENGTAMSIRGDGFFFFAFIQFAYEIRNAVVSAQVGGNDGSNGCIRHDSGAAACGHSRFFLFVPTSGAECIYRSS